MVGEKNRQQVKEKYEKDSRYHANFEDVSKRFSLRNKFGFYFEYRKSRETINLLNETKTNLKNKKILDIGCHRGFQLHNFAFLKGTAEKIYGVDFIPEFINDAKNINPKINFEVMDVYDLKFGKESFDFVSLFCFLDCIPIQDRKIIGTNISSIITKGGYLLVFDLSHNMLINQIRRIIKLLKGEYNPKLECFNDLILKKYFKEFNVIKSKRVVGFLSPTLCKYLSPPFVELIDYFTPKEFYIALLKKNK